MTILIPFLFLAYAVLYAFALSIPQLPTLHLPASPFARIWGGVGAQNLQKPLQQGLEGWIQWEEGVALEKLLANIASSDDEALRGAVKGSVIASPSREGPDYFYQWVRDAAITISTLVDVYADDPTSKRGVDISKVLDAYAELQYTLQHTTNPSGGFDDLSGLGEPKFEADGSAFVGSWGRPQRDGPALRAITLISYIRAYNASHPSLWASEKGEDWFSRFYEASLPARGIIKADLEYVSHFWNQSGFDLWEEVDGMHFFTAMVQLRALREGADIARAFADPRAADWYGEQAQYLEEYVHRFWDERKGHLIETLDTPRTGLDCGLLLGSLHAYPSKASSHAPIYAPYSDEILISLLALIQDQSIRFPINAAHSSPSSSPDDEPTLEGIGLGRYPEDIYDGYGNDPSRGGNPWFLCTSSAAEIIYHTASHITNTANMAITPINLPFYTALLSSSSLDPELNTVYGPSDAVFHSVVERLMELGDEFLDVVRVHASKEGSMSEQFDRVTGFERGARDLTWSYGAFLQAVRKRKGVVL